MIITITAIVMILSLILFIKKKRTIERLSLRFQTTNNIHLVKTHDLTYDMKNQHEYTYNFNPSGIYIGNNRFITSVRGWNGNIRTWDGKNVLYLSKIKFYGDNIVREYGNTLNILPEPDVEDARLFLWNNEIWILCNGLNNADKRHMFLVKINDNGTEFTNDVPIELCSYESQNFEKNWSPFLIGDELYFIYSIVPFVILKYNKENKKCSRATFGTNKFFYNLSSRYHNKLFIRGGTPFLQLGKNQWIGIGHSVIKNISALKKLIDFNILASDNYKENIDDRKWLRSYNNLYLMFFYTVKYYDGEFMIDRISYMFQPPFLHYNIEYIVFPSGLTEDDENYYIFFGENDTMSMMTTMNKKFTLNLLHDINNLTPETYIIDIKYIEKILPHYIK